LLWFCWFVSVISLTIPNVALLISTASLAAWLACSAIVVVLCAAFVTELSVLAISFRIFPMVYAVFSAAIFTSAWVACTAV
jgi:hypothetical protein